MQLAGNVWRRHYDRKRFFGTVNLRICGYQCQLNKRMVADYSAMGWAVTGDTYKAKKYIKQLGFVWDSDIKAWTTTDRSVALAAAINY